MMSPRTLLRTFFAAAALVAAVYLVAPAPASAATFSVNPTQIYLAGRTTSTLLTLRNDSTETLRFQLTVFEWHQGAGGEIELTPTQDVVFFPALLSLNAGEERRVRVGSTTAAGTVEKTYRIFVEELPPSGPQGDATQVRVLTKMGIPIFVRPEKETANGALAGLGLREGALHFAINNTGNVHFVPQSITVRGMAGEGQPVFEQSLTGWYVLAGGRREFDVAVPAAECGRVASLVIDVGLGTSTLKESLPTPGGACAR
jgi:fimbrial chaperone protein